MEKSAHVQWTLETQEGGAACAGTRIAAKFSTGCFVTHVLPALTSHSMGFVPPDGAALFVLPDNIPGNSAFSHLQCLFNRLPPPPPF